MPTTRTCGTRWRQSSAISRMNRMASALTRSSGRLVVAHQRTRVGVGPPGRALEQQSRTRRLGDLGVAVVVLAQQRPAVGVVQKRKGGELGQVDAVVEDQVGLKAAVSDVTGQVELTHLDAAIAQVVADTDDPAERVIEFVRVFEEGADDLMSAQSSCLYVSVLTERGLVERGTSSQITAAIVA